jgi:hypothetical protein
MNCGCIVDYKKDGKWRSRQCRNKAYIQHVVHQHNEHTKIGTGWYWVPICPKHLNESGTMLFDERKGTDWK